MTFLKSSGKLFSNSKIPLQAFINTLLYFTFYPYATGEDQEFKPKAYLNHYRKGNLRNESWSEGRC